MLFLFCCVGVSESRGAECSRRTSYRVALGQPYGQVSAAQIRSTAAAIVAEAISRGGGGARNADVLQTFQGLPERRLHHGATAAGSAGVESSDLFGATAHSAVSSVLAPENPRSIRSVPVHRIEAAIVAPSDRSEIDRVCERCSCAGRAGFAFSLAPDGSSVTGLALAVDSTTVWYIPLGDGIHHGSRESPSMPKPTGWQAVAEICGFTTVELVSSSIRRWWKVLHRRGIGLAPPYVDVAVAAWLVDPDSIKVQPGHAAELFAIVFGRDTGAQRPAVYHTDRLDARAASACEDALASLEVWIRLARAVESAELGRALTLEMAVRRRPSRLICSGTSVWTWFHVLLLSVAG